MEAVFLKLLNMSITAGWLVLAVVALRFLLKKAPKSLRCILWALVGIRLLCPFSFESSLSLIPSAETVPEKILSGPTFDISTGVDAIDAPVNGYLGDHYFEGVSVPADNGSNVMRVLTFIWAAGLAVMLLYALFSFLSLRGKVSASIPLKDKLWLCDDISFPFILGVFRPRIYLSSGIDDDELAHVKAHENAHLRRRDHLWKPFSFLLLCVYWFNPLMWLAYILLCRDIELACDERVVKKMDISDKKAYSTALLSCSVPRRMIAVCPLAFGEVGVKERIKTVLNYKKPAFWIITVAVLACAAVAVCFLTNPKTKRETMQWAQTLNTNDVKQIELVVMPQSEDKQYRLYSGDELNGIVSLINGSKGKYLSEHEDLAGVSIVFYLTMNDGTKHTVYNIGNTYLVIDGDYYDASHDWLSSWDNSYGEGNDFLPSGFYSNPLTLDRVIELSAKGEALDWSDFVQFSHIDTGSGLYIQVYEIDELFSLWIGGTNQDETPWYIRLSAGEGVDDYIDIRTEDVESFILEHQSSSTSTVGGADSPQQVTGSSAPIENILSADYASDEFLGKPDTFERFADDDTSEYSVPIVFTAGDEISDFRFLAVSFDETSENGTVAFKIGETLYSQDTLSSDKPLVIDMVFVGSFPTRGLSFTDKNGVTRYCSVNISGKDGSILLTEFSI